MGAALIATLAPLELQALPAEIAGVHDLVVRIGGIFHQNKEAATITATATGTPATEHGVMQVAASQTLAELKPLGPILFTLLGLIGHPVADEAMASFSAFAESAVQTIMLGHQLATALTPPAK